MVASTASHRRAARSGDPGTEGSWIALVPVKALDVAKSRLALPAEQRADIALAMARDVVTALLATPGVRRILVVTDDSTVTTAFQATCDVVPDVPNAGLSAALAHGAQIAALRWPGYGVVAITADLPAMTATALSSVLDRCVGDRNIVADAAGRGTVLLAARNGVALAPAFEGDSRRAHVSGGAQDMSRWADSGLRRDVDTLADLALARTLGLGSATSEVINNRGLFT